MLLAATYAEADARRRVVEVQGHPYVLREYVGAAPLRGTYLEGSEANDNRLPQGFLVEQPPGAVTPPHFHETNQFQVFVGGTGRLGKRRADPVTVQFAGGHTPYGPIVAEDEGVRYFTLRQLWDPGAKYMPGMRELLRRGRQRQRVGTGADRPPPADGAAPWQVIFGPEPDGLLAASLRLGAGGAAELPDAAEGGGQYLVVLGGGAIDRGSAYPELSCLYATPDEGVLAVAAGAEGLDALVLRFPRSPDAG